MSVPGGDETARTGCVVLSMTAWGGRWSGRKYLGSWDEAVEFLRSADFHLMGDVRTVMLKQLGPSLSHWSPSPAEAAELEERARREFACRECDAAPGEPCAGSGSGRAVHAPRYIDAKKAAVAEARAVRSPRPGGTA